MKYKNIYSAIHNLGHSFVSLMNYVDGRYIIDDLFDLRSEGLDIEIDFLNSTFMPGGSSASRIEKSLRHYSENLKKHLQSQHIDLNRMEVLKFHWPAKGRKFMRAVDDRGKEYKIYISEMK